MVIADGLGLILYLNDAFVSAFGWTREELTGASLSVLIPPPLRDAHQMGFSRFVISGQPRLMGVPLKLRALHRDGSEMGVELQLCAEETASGWEIGATLRPRPGQSIHE